MTEDEMVGQYRQLNGLEFEQALGDEERQGSLACCSPWGHKESDMTQQLNNNNNGHSQVALGVGNLPASVGRRHGTPLQYSCLENPRDRGAW